MWCQLEGCNSPVLARGYCGKHYKRFMRGEDLTVHNKGNQTLPRGGLAALGLHRHHPFYLAWVNMKTRCDNSKSTQYPWYGGRGISYCPEWAQFSIFHHDMWHRWHEGLSLDRRDNDAGYSAENCRWVPIAAQSQNRRPRDASK